MCAMFRNASHFPSEGSLGGLISGLSGALRQVGDAAASVLGGRGVRMDEDGQGPFEAAVQAAAGSGNDTDAMMAALSKHSVRLTPLIKRRVFPDLPGVPRGVALGWAQLTSGEGATVSIGLFIGHDRFSQIALADGNGRVFVTSDPHADTHDMKPRFMLVKEEEFRSHKGTHKQGNDLSLSSGKQSDLVFHPILKPHAKLRKCLHKHFPVLFSYGRSKGAAVAPCVGEGKVFLYGHIGSRALHRILEHPSNE